MNKRTTVKHKCHKTAKIVSDWDYDDKSSIS